jgi:type IV secretory pathway TrbL component
VTDQQPALPDRPPRSLLVHFGVDSAVAFLALIVLGLLIGVGWGVIAVVALVIGAIAARFTRQAEARALAARREQASGP